MQSVVASIVDSSDEWVRRIKRREFYIRLVSALFTTVFFFFITLIVFVVSMLVVAGIPIQSATSASITAYLQDHVYLYYELGASAFIIGPASGLVTYFLLRWRQGQDLKELSTLISRMKKKLGSTSTEDEEGIPESGLYVADRIVEMLPETLRKRTQDSFIFGVIAFFIAGLVGRNVAIAVLVGAIVWLFFRYESQRSYERERAKFDERRRLYEDRKKDFLESL
jgi:hypothetical protein